MSNQTYRPYRVNEMLLRGLGDPLNGFPFEDVKRRLDADVAQVVRLLSDAGWAASKGDVGGVVTISVSPVGARGFANENRWEEIKNSRGGIPAPIK